MNYKVFLIRSDSNIFLFEFRKQPQLRPSVGDVLTNPLTFEQFKILRDEFDNSVVRVTDDGRLRITDNGDIRATHIGVDPDETTHNYFVTPANNPNRIASYTTNKFDDDQTLRQLFR